MSQTFGGSSGKGCGEKPCFMCIPTASDLNWLGRSRSSKKFFMSVTLSHKENSYKPGHWILTCSCWSRENYLTEEELSQIHKNISQEQKRKESEKQSARNSHQKSVAMEQKKSMAKHIALNENIIDKQLPKLNNCMKQK